MAVTDKTYAVGGAKWEYPHQKAPPRGKKIALLTEGGMQTHGHWQEDGGFIGWQYLFKRDKEAEYVGRQLASLKEMEMDEGEMIRRFRVPETLPVAPEGWTRVLNVRWNNDDLGTTAEIYKLVDEKGNTTPITYQWDRRDPPVFDTGYSIINTGRTFCEWSELRAYWPEYINQLKREQSEACERDFQCDCASSLDAAPTENEI